MVFQPRNTGKYDLERFALPGDNSILYPDMTEVTSGGDASGGGDPGCDPGYASTRFAERRRAKLRASSRDTCIWETPSSALICDWVRLL